MSQPDPKDPPAQGYEEPDTERPASATSTEKQLEQESLHGAAAPAHDPYAALRFAEFRRFSIGSIISIVGSQMLSAAIGWEIYDRTRSSLALGWVAGIQFVPLVVLALPGGQLADVFDRRRIVALASLVAAAASLGLAWLSYRTGLIPLMYATLLLNAAAQTLGRPAKYALLPSIVAPSAFSNAVTWNSSFFQLSAMVGPALAGLAIRLSPRLPYALDAICGLIFALIMATLPRPRFAPESPAKATESESKLQSLLAGIRFVWKTKIILATLSLDLFAVLLGGAVYLLPAFAKDILKVDSIHFGLLRAAEAVGACTMAMLIAHLPPMKKAGRSMLLAVAGFGVATIIFGLSHNFWLSFATLFFIGAFDNISVVVRHTLVQVLTPDAMRGRVSAVNNIFIGSSNELGGFESGVTADWWGPVVSVVFGGCGTIAVVLATAGIFPGLRKFGSLQDARPVELSGEISEDRPAEPAAGR